MRFSAPEKLARHHDCSKFDCGEASLNDWLKNHAHRSEGRTSRSYVVCDEAGTVAAFYCLAAGSLSRAQAPKKLQRNAPDPIPITVLGRLAVDLKFQRRGLGSAMVRDAMMRTVAAADATGIAGLLVHVLNEDVKNFYLGLGFRETPVEDTVVISTMELRQAIEDI